MSDFCKSGIFIDLLEIETIIIDLKVNRGLSIFFRLATVRLLSA